jgi:hypothetical protein
MLTRPTMMALQSYYRGQLAFIGVPEMAATLYAVTQSIRLVRSCGRALI